MDKMLASDIKFASRLFYATQKERVALGNIVQAKEKEGILSKRMKTMYENMRALEKNAEEVCKELVEFTGLKADFFDHISGVGPLLTAALIAEIQDIAKFPTVSSLWAYFGLTTEYVLAKCGGGHKLIMSSEKRTECPVLEDAGSEDEDGPVKYKRCGAKIEIIEKVTGKSPRKAKGYHFLFNTKGKTIVWKITQQFIKQGDQFYKDIYYTEKEKQMNLGVPKNHAHNRALRKMGKMFLSHLWEAWRQIDGLEVRPPYVIEKLGHSSYMPWAEVAVLLREGKKIVRAAKG